MRTSFKWMVAAILTLASATSANAAVLTAITGWTGGTDQQPLTATTFGYQFKVYSGIYVTQMGIYDYDSNGLSQQHEVGIWNSSGTLLGSTTLVSGTGATLTNNFRYNSVTPFFLAGSGGGTLYTIGAYYQQNSPDWLRVSPTTVNDSSEVDWVKGVQGSSGPSLVRPTTDSSYNFGPNFRYTTTANEAGIPEPSTFVMFGAGALGLLVAARRRRRG